MNGTKSITKAGCKLTVHTLPTLIGVFVLLLISSNLNADSCIGNPVAVATKVQVVTNAQCSYAVNFPAGSSLLIFVNAVSATAAESITSASFASTPVVTIGEVDTTSGNNGLTAILWCPNPPGASGQLIVNFASKAYWTVVAQAYNDVTTPINFVSAQGVPGTSSVNLTINPTTYTESYIVFTDSSSVNTTFCTSGCTGIPQTNYSNTRISSETGYLEAPTPGSYTITRNFNTTTGWVAAAACELPEYCVSPTNTPTITTTISPTITRTYTATITQTMTQTSTQTTTETITETITETATQTITGTETETVTETSTPSITQTITKTATNTATPTRTASMTQTATQTYTQTNTGTTTVTPTTTATITQTNTQTATQTNTPQASATPTSSPTVTKTYTVTMTTTATFTQTATATITPPITILKTVNNQFPTFGDTVTYSLLITSNTNSTFSVWDTIPAIMNFVGCDNSCLTTGGTPNVVYWNISLSPGNSVTYHFWAQIVQYPYFKNNGESEFAALCRHNKEIAAMLNNRTYQPHDYAAYYR